MDKQMLELRKDIKGRKPVFLRQEVFKRKRLAKVWRRPKGVHSKMRHNKKGHRKMVRPGYGSPNSVKYFHLSGLVQIRVFSLNDLKNINSREEGALIASTVGLKNKLEILKEAKARGIHVLNVKNIDEFLKNAEQQRKMMKEERLEKLKSKEEDKKKAKKAEKKEEAKEKEMTEEERKEAEKKEKEKVLTKKEM